MKTFIGIPSIRHYEPFWQSMDNFLPILKRMCDLHIHIVKDKEVADARNEIADKFLESNSDYLLFLDDDHTDHSLDMFVALLKPLDIDKPGVCTIKSHTKFFPYNSNTCIYSKADEKSLGLQEGRGRYMPIDFDSGYFFMDLVGMGMTLITRPTFSIIEKPYFVSKNVGGKNVHEDNYFCEKIIEKGVRPSACFDYTLPHNGINKETARKGYKEGYAKIKEKYPEMKVLVA